LAENNFPNFWLACSPWSSAVAASTSVGIRPRQSTSARFLWISPGFCLMISGRNCRVRESETPTLVMNLSHSPFLLTYVSKQSIVLIHGCWPLLDLVYTASNENNLRRWVPHPYAHSHPIWIMTHISPARKFSAVPLAEQNQLSSCIPWI
jgi:hypothetical protein